MRDIREYCKLKGEFTKMGKVRKLKKNGKNRTNLKFCRPFFAMALVIILLFGLVGCGDAEEETVVSNEISVCIASEPRSIDPTLIYALDEAIYVAHFFEGLMKYEPGEDGGAVVANGQAKEVTISEDQLTYTFTLRDHIKWSDGKAVTSYDFAYAWKRLVNPKVNAEYSSFLDYVVNAKAINNGEIDVNELGVETPDEKTFIVHLVAPTSYFLESCAGSQLVPLREDVVENDENWTEDNYIVNGPYKMGKWNHEELLTMVANDQYYDRSRVTAKKINWTLMADQSAMLARYENGLLDVITDVPVDEIKNLNHQGEINYYPLLGTYGVAFNMDVVPLNDSRVREALSLVIDRNYICNEVVRTGVKPAAAWVPSGIHQITTDNNVEDFREQGGSYYSVEAKDYSANCERAKALLAEAGYPNGRGFPEMNYLYNTGDVHKKTYEALAQMWKEKLGIEVTGIDQEWNLFLTSRTNGDFTLARHGWNADYNDASTFLDLWTTEAIGSNNYSRWSCNAFDQRISMADKEKDADTRNVLLHQAEDLLMQDAAVAPLYFYEDKACINEQVSGVFHCSLGYFFFKYCTKQEKS